MFARFAFKTKVVIILKMINFNYQLTRRKLTGLCVRNCAAIQQVLILKFAFRGCEKLSGLSRNGPLAEVMSSLLRLEQ